MSLDNVLPGKNVPTYFNVIIEIPMNADPIKYEVEKIQKTKGKQSSEWDTVKQYWAPPIAWVLFTVCKFGEAGITAPFKKKVSPSWKIFHSRVGQFLNPIEKRL